MNAFVIDAFDYSRLGEHREGDIAVSALPRLAEETTDDTAQLHWSLQGGTDHSGRPQLVLRVTGAVSLVCQRCLAPLPFAIDAESRLVLAKNEVQADELDALLAEESVDVIVGSKAFDVHALIEDEALLALPPAPRHDVCPGVIEQATDEDGSRPSPFAVLKNTRH